jgi:ACS family hexuronate transporter-like MFS transporter
MTGRSRFPWFTLGMLSTATALSFLDRQVMSVLAPKILSALGITNIAYSHIVFAFQLSYTVMSALGGYMIDRLGVKRGLAISLGIWSAATAASAFVRSAGQLAATRFALGIGEGACFPAATRGAAEYAEPKDRSFATGIATGGSAIGAVLAPPLIVLLAMHYGWRGAFLSTGLFGIFWCVAWIVGVKPPLRSSPKMASMNCRGLSRRPGIGWFLAARFMFDPVFYFFMFWIPQFLASERGLSLQSIGNLFWIPFLTLSVSQIFGGKLSDVLSKNTNQIAIKQRMLLLAAAITPISFFAGKVHNLPAAITCMSILFLAHGIWITNYLSLVNDLFSQEQNASIVGLTGMVGGVSGMISTLIIGRTVDRFSFFPVFVVSALMYPCAYVLVSMAITTARRAAMTSTTEGAL